MTQTNRLQKQINGLWTAQEICERWGVTAMTVHLWRNRGLPALSIPGYARDAVRFVPEDVKNWTKRNDIQPRRRTPRRRERYRPAAA